MIPELGHLSLILSFILALSTAIVPLYGSFRISEAYMNLARPLTYLSTALLLFAFAALMFSFATNDFSVLYVAKNASRELPLMYRLTAVWGAHEGSMLLWCLLLGVWAVAVARYSQALPLQIVSRVLSVLAWITSGFLAFLLFTSNPFLRLLPNMPTNGRDLNPLLQDPGFLIHPPMLYMGYVGFAVSFAFVIACLLSGKLDQRWARWSRPWVLAAWCFLTFGITLGSWWAYRELGWGGWWFWDPVENASFLPWLTGTALLHSLLVSQKRDTFKAWNALLAILAFALSIIGTFLVRSGILTSVHAFAVDPKRGVFMLALLFIVIATSLLIYAWRAHTITSRQHFSLLSRESLLLSNNVILSVAMATVLLGTLYPLIIEALHLGKLSVGAPYFNAVFVPLMMPLLFLLGLGPHCQWQSMSVDLLRQRMQFTFLISLSVGLILSLLFLSAFYWNVLIGLVLSTWITLSTFQALVQAKKRGQTLPWPMAIAHLGVAVTLAGITVASHYSTERLVRIKLGDQVSLSGYTINLAELKPLHGPNYRGTQALFSIQHQNTQTTVIAEKRIYTVTNMAMTDSGIVAGLFRDIYVALGEPYTDGSWSVRMYYKPFVRWIWLGGLLMLLGGLMAFGRTRQDKDT